MPLAGRARRLRQSGAAAVSAALRARRASRGNCHARRFGRAFFRAARRRTAPRNSTTPDRSTAPWLWAASFSPTMKTCSPRPRGGFAPGQFSRPSSLRISFRFPSASASPTSSWWRKPAEKRMHAARSSICRWDRVTGGQGFTSGNALTENQAAHLSPRPADSVPCSMFPTMSGG